MIDRDITERLIEHNEENGDLKMQYLLVAERLEARDEITRLRAREAELVEALSWFTLLADYVDKMDHEDDSTCLHRIKADDLRRARAAIKDTSS